MPNSRITGNPDAPDVVGFEFPHESKRQGTDKGQVALVMLNATPSRDWVGVFLEEADAFQSHNQLRDVRIVGSNISLIGGFSDARNLTVSAKLLVENTSRLLARRHLQHRDRPVQELPQVGDGQDQARAHDVAMVDAMEDTRHILSEVIRMTGMRFAAIARVTDTRWTACAVYDLLEFGLRPGQDLALESTICNEIRQEPRTIAFEQASRHPQYATHRTPALYGFESYISVPIWAADGSFFGTLCALDPRPVVLGPELIGAIEAFARGIGRQLPASTTELDSATA